MIGVPAPSDPEAARKRACAELATLLARPEGLHQFRLTQMVFRMASEPAPPSEPAPASEADKKPGPIGIWIPRDEDGRTVFVRSADPPAEADLWPPHDRLVPKTSDLPLRVCFLGESAAAGMFYRPRVTPAKVLQAHLGKAYEVIDLTKVSIGPVEIVELAVDADQLGPDVLVFFAGNNWASRVMPRADLGTHQETAAILGEEGAAGLVRFHAEALRRLVRNGLDDLASIAGARGIPVVVVVPEVNLADWERRRPPAWFPGDATPRWHGLHARARAALEARRFDEAADLAAGMIGLDAGTCATSHRILARARMAQGRLEEALSACRAEVDASSWDGFFPGVPQATSVLREELLRGAVEHGFACVDLAAVFRGHSGSPLPGRRYFLDYCHLTSEAMGVAMGAVAAEVLRAAGAGEEAPVRGEAPAEVEGLARFMGALHTAHMEVPLGERSAGVAPALEAAVAAWPGLLDSIEDFLVARFAPCPGVLTSAQRRIQAAHELDLHVWAWPNLDADLSEAALDVLESHGRPRGRLLGKILGDRSGARPIDLTHPAFRGRLTESFAGNMEYEALLTDRTVFRAPWPESTFCWLADGARDATIDVEARLPSIERPRSGRVGVFVNGAEAGTLDASEMWCRGSFRAERRLLRRGINRVAVRWPDLPPEGDAALRKARERLIDGLAPELFPVFGELFSVLVRER